MVWMSSVTLVGGIRIGTRIRIRIRRRVEWEGGMRVASVVERGAGEDAMVRVCRERGECDAWRRRGHEVTGEARDMKWRRRRGKIGRGLRLESLGRSASAWVRWLADMRHMIWHDMGVGCGVVVWRWRLRGWKGGGRCREVGARGLSTDLAWMKRVEPMRSEFLQACDG
jgi:hypothetical protein